jgi:hypothetical protein
MGRVLRERRRPDYDYIIIGAEGRAVTNAV